MKVQVFVFIAFLVHLSSAGFAPPDAVLAKLREYREKSIALLETQISASEEVHTRFGLEWVQNFMDAETDKLFETIKFVGSSHFDLSEVLKAELPNSPSCIANLQKIIDSTKIFYGYSITNCINYKDYIERGSEMVSQATINQVALPRAFIGRNVYSEEHQDDIINRIIEIYNAAEQTGSTSEAEAYSELNLLHDEWKYDNEIVLAECLNDVQNSIVSEYTTATNKITSCRNFGSQPAQ